MRYLPIFGALLLVFACHRQAADTYTMIVLSERAEKDSVFAVPGASPLDEIGLSEFRGLHYYDVDPAYRIVANFQLNPDPVPFGMPTTTERRPIYVHYGTARFSLHGRELELRIYQNQELVSQPGYERYLFIPFRDATSGVETYGGGRYIDAELPEGDSILIDFNRAYNPYCAYNSRYSCPLPPVENTLAVEVRAGERYIGH